MSMDNNSWSLWKAVLATFSDIAAMRANMAYASGQTEKARKMLERCIAKKTKNPVVYSNYADLKLREGDGQAALECLQTALSLKPYAMQEKTIRHAIGTAHWLAGDHAQAIAALEQMRADYEYVNESVLTTLGYLYFVEGNLDKAQELTDMALAEVPNYAAAWDNRGQILFAQNDLEQAKEAFGKALEQKPSLVDSLFGMGLIHEVEGNHEAAADCFRQAMDAPRTALNTVTEAQLAEKLEEYVKG